jgi:hypothetical protein
MASRRPAGGWLQGPAVFWCLFALLLLAIYGGFRLLAPRRASATRLAASAMASRPAAKAAASTTLWGGKPLQLKKPAAPAPGAPAAPVAAVLKGVGLRPEEVAARIQQVCPALVVFFSTDSGASQEMFPQLVKLSQWDEAPEVVAFATDQDASAVDTFLRVNGAGFNAALLYPTKPGELAAALSEIGIKVGKQLNLPLVVVVGSDCKIRGQWPGLTELGPVAAMLHTVEAHKDGPE